MQAYVLTQYGPAKDSLTLSTVPKPTATKNHVLIKVHAAGLNAADWHLTRGDPYLIRLMTGVSRPKANLLAGTALSGTVEEVGPDCTLFKVGDQVMTEPGLSILGAFSEYVSVPEDMVCEKPVKLSLEEAAAIPVSGTTAYQAIHKFAKLQAGQSILINGASGGVGTAAVQIAKAVGAEVTTVTSGTTMSLMKQLGADFTIDYKTQDFTQMDKMYDCVLDIVGTASISACCKVVKPDGIYVSVGSIGSGTLIGNIPDVIGSKMNPFKSRRVELAMNTPSRVALLEVKELVDGGKLKMVIEKRFDFNHVKDAMELLEAGHVAGKVIVRVSS
ncbi:hypothetical protein HDU99_001211 [Rhizoclosmatium hyalinum]|nr:hypothetical protein HDU99_001211 [Rhizoclosmatium hyalinum]